MNRTPAQGVLQAAALIAQTTALAEAVAEVEELRATSIATAENFDLRQAWRVDWERTLDAFVGDDAAHGDHFMHATSGARQKHALEDLDALLVTFDDLVVDVDRVADGELRQVSLVLELAGNDAFEHCGTVELCHK